MNNLFKLISIITLAVAGFTINAMEQSEGRFLTAIENKREGFGGEEILLYVTNDTAHSTYYGPSFEYGPASGTTLVKFSATGRHNLHKKIDLVTTGRAPMLIVADLIHDKVNRFTFDEISDLPTGNIKLIINSKGEMTLAPN